MELPGVEKKKILIAIGGCSASGKTTLAWSLREALGLEESVISQDRFACFETCPIIQGEPSGILWRNWECPESLDWEMLLAFLERAKRTWPEDIVIFEGFLAYNHPRISQLFDVKLLIALPHDEHGQICLRRRLERASDSLETYAANPRHVGPSFTMPDSNFFEVYWREVAWPEAVKNDPRKLDLGEPPLRILDGAKPPEQLLCETLGILRQTGLIADKSQEHHPSCSLS